jgi:uncharacterized protein YjbJ (UPF0337 family)
MDRDEIKGKVEKAKGYVKDKAGEIINDPDLEAQGEVEQAEGEVREGFGKARRKVEEGIEEVKDEIDDHR